MCLHPAQKGREVCPETSASSQAPRKTRSITRIIARLAALVALCCSAISSSLSAQDHTAARISVD